jgi:glycosyltransferase involved in cell wall biosynthesis
MVGGGDLAEEIQQQAPDNLSLLGWQIPERVWPVADIALSTSHNEGIPISIIEAQMAGVPVVAVNVGAISQVVIDGQTGTLTSENTTEIISAIRKLIDDPELLVEYALNSKTNFAEKFQIDKFVIEYLRIYSNIRIANA